MLLHRHLQIFYSTDDGDEGNVTSGGQPPKPPKPSKPADPKDSDIDESIVESPAPEFDPNKVSYSGKAVNESNVFNSSIEGVVRNLSQSAAGDGVQGYRVDLLGNNDPFSIYKKTTDGFQYIAGKGDPNREGVFNEAGYSMEGFLNSIGLTYDRLQSRILNVESINANKTMNPIDVVSFGRGYIFFTKPDLMLYTLTEDGTYDINPSIKVNMPDLYIKIKKNPLVARSLQSSLAFSPITRSDYGFIHLLGNMCVEAPAPEISLSKIEGTKNVKDYGVKYGGDFLSSIGPAEISLSFYDNRYRDVTTMLEIWTQYIEGISQGKIYKKKGYRDGNIIDYAISIYIFTVDETNLVMGHSSYIGCFPSSIPTTINGYRREPYGAEHFLGPFATQWQVSMCTRPNAHSTIEAFNYASGYKRVVANMEKDTHYGMSWPQTYKGGFKANKVGNWTATGGKVDTDYIMHKSIEAWGLDIIRDTEEDANILKGYRHQLSITEYWPQYAGVTLTNTSGGVQQYALIFFSTKEYLNRIKFKDRGPYDYEDLINFDRFYTLDFDKLGVNKRRLQTNTLTEAEKAAMTEKNASDKSAYLNLIKWGHYYYKRKMALIYAFGDLSHKEIDMSKIRGRVSTIDHGDLYVTSKETYVPKLVSDGTASQIHGTGGAVKEDKSETATVSYRDHGHL